MSASFTNQVIAQIELHQNTGKYKKKVYMLPKHLDEQVARLHLDHLGVKLTKLSKDQADYIGVPVDGPSQAGPLSLLKREPKNEERKANSAVKRRAQALQDWRLVDSKNVGSNPTTFCQSSNLPICQCPKGPGRHVTKVCQPLFICRPSVAVSESFLGDALTLRHRHARCTSARDLRLTPLPLPLRSPVE